MRALQPSDPARAQPGSPRVKGTLIVTLIKFLRSKGLDPAAVIAQLPPPDREVLLGILLPGGWYSAEVFARFLEVAATATCKGEKSDCLKEMGAFSAHTNLGPGGLRQAYIRTNDPHHVLTVIARIYQNVYTHGRRTYEHTGERSAIVRGYGTRVAHDHCLWAAGWLQRVVELSGASDVRVIEVQCEGSGAPHCEYRIDWA